jgi:hypothetical protein
LNVAGVNQSLPTEYFSFTTAPEPGAVGVTYEDLSFFCDTYSSGGASVMVSMIDGAGPEQILATNIAVPGNNADVALRTVDFADFTSPNVVQWRIYPYGSAASNHGVRFDDVVLHGTAQTAVIPEPSTFLIWSLGLLGLIGWRRRK